MTDVSGFGVAFDPNETTLIDFTPACFGVPTLNVTVPLATPYQYRRVNVQAQGGIADFCESTVAENYPASWDNAIILHSEVSPDSH